MNLFLPSIVLTLINLPLSTCITSEHFYIVPISNIDDCAKYPEGTCFTLSEFSNYIRKTVLNGHSITLSFLPGEHILTSEILIFGPSNLTLVWEDSLPSKIPTVTCQGTSGFKLQYIQNIHIEHLAFTSCGGSYPDIDHVMSIGQVNSVLVSSCHFIGSQGNSYSGGAIQLAITEETIIKDSIFEDNCIFENDLDGGAIDFADGSIHISNSTFINNRALNGGAISMKNGSIFISNCNFTNSVALDGAVITVINSSISVDTSRFTNNKAHRRGGVITGYSSSVNIVNCQFMNNNAIRGGVIYTKDSSFYTNKCQFSSNYAITHGGAIDVENGNATINNTTFTNHDSLGQGGVINIYNGSISSYNSQYTSNSANILAGVIFLGTSHFFAHNNEFENNAACEGGVVSLYSSSTTVTDSLLTNNIAQGRPACGVGAAAGGVYYSFTGNNTITSTNNQYVENSSDGDGGVLYLFGNKTSINRCEMSGDYFHSNVAERGAVTFSTRLILTFKDVTFVENSADDRHVIYFQTSTMIMLGGINFINNNGSLYAFSSQVEFHGLATFSNNRGLAGGAISSIQSQILFNNTEGPINISNNTAVYGGGLSLTQSTLIVFHTTEISGNTADISGGGLYMYQSTIEFKSEETNKVGHSFITSNTASTNGGGICALSTVIMVSQTFVHLSSNSAGANGGGMYLEQNTKVYLFKYDLEWLIKNPQLYKPIRVQLEIVNNSADNGGGIYVSDSTTASACESVNTEVEQTIVSHECFIQTLKVYDDNFNQIYNTVNTVLINNTAHQSGHSIYGGLLDRCTINPRAEVLQSNVIRKWNGLDYIKATIQFETGNEPNEQLKGLVSSSAVQVEFCEDNKPVFIRKGALLKASVAAIDQIGNPVNSTIISSVFTRSGVGRLKEGQEEQVVGDQCTELQYNVFSQDSSAQVQLYADGPCINLGISLQTLNLSFAPCTCPVGFQPTASNIKCECECDSRLQRFGIHHCFYENSAIEVENNIWIGINNITNKTGYIVQNCPFDYCMEKPINISLNSSLQIDQQCAYNRSGILCGECEEGLSLMLATSRCKECSNIYLLLLIPFALAGIALVVFILLLNVTMATGTIHGLIFYANIFAANLSVFRPIKTPNFLSVFVSWVNLDFGIEICLYDGMNSQSKVLLQLVFPAYLFFLIFVIIILSKYINSFSRLLSNRNPVAALSTLILLSYSKLLRAIIATLQYTFLDYADGSREIVWLYDANVQYFSISHIPRFVAAATIITGGGLFTMLLFFGQWLSYFSEWKIMKWTGNTKYTGFMDTIQAPFVPKHRYWVGLLLFSLITHNLVVALATDEYLPVLSSGCIALGLIVLKLLNSRIYKTWLNDSLETFFLLNLGILAYGTSYVGDTDSNQLALANTSMALSFILFLVIICYHFYEYVLKKTSLVLKCKNRLKKFQAWRKAHNRQELNHLVGEDNEPVEDDYSINQGDTIEPYTDEAREEPDPQRYFTPPIVRPAVNYSQLREPDLDILAPVNEEDYKAQSPPPPRVRNPPLITRTVIDPITQPDT